MKKLFLLVIVIAAITSSCKKEEIIVPPTPIPTPQYVFKQTAYLWENAVGIGDSLYPIFTYRIAVMAGVHFDSVTVKLTVTLYDSTKVILNENDLVNFAQIGFYTPNYQYPEYWIATLSDSKGIYLPFYNFTKNDIYRFEYEAKVKINGTWYTVPKEGRKLTDPFESFWI